MTEELEKRVRDLRERVLYLEQELDLSVDERRFEKRIGLILPAGQDFEVEESGMGHYLATVDIPPSDIPRVAKKISDADDLGWHVKDSDEESITISIEQGLHHA